MAGVVTGLERLVGGLLRALQGPPRLLAVGSQAPDFEVFDHRGRLVRLGDWRGRRTVLWFYPRAGTSG
jgi:hypothetical protein